MTAAALGGWLAAVLVAALALRARRSLDAGREAVARACHELRGPLTAARLGLSLQSPSDDSSVQRLRAIDAELSRAALAVDDLAAAQRREPGGGVALGQLTRVDLRELVAAAVEAAQGRAAAAGVAVRVGAPRAPGPGAVRPGEPAGGTVVWGDPLRLAQAVSNLIANAIEHGGRDVRAFAVARGPFVRVEVCDAGPGLPAPVAQLARGARRGRGARGRGLAIALAIARRHGGTVAAAPARVGGRVVLELPAARVLHDDAGSDR